MTRRLPRRRSRADGAKAEAARPGEGWVEPGTPADEAVASPTQVFDDLLRRTGPTFTHEHPRNLTKARGLFVKVDSFPMHQQVNLIAPISTVVRGKNRPLVLRGPRDAWTLFVRLQAGNPRLEVKDGHVVILADSVWGNSITVQAEASVTVVCGLDRKVTVRLAEGAKVEALGDLSRYSAWSEPA